MPTAAVLQPVNAVPPLALARANMVNNQLKPNGIRNVAVRHRFSDVPRENFCAPAVAGLGYRDSSLPQASAGRALYAPLAQAKLLQALDLQPTDTLLVLAAGSGYGAALAAGLCAHVIVLEDDLDLRNAASHNLTHTAGLTAQLTFLNIPLPTLTSPAPVLPVGKIDAILLDAAADALPACLTGLLATGGRVAAVVPDLTGVMAACLFTRQAAENPTAPGWPGINWSAGWQPEILLETTAPVLPAWARKPEFIF